MNPVPLPPASRRARPAFTLVELLFVCVIVAILLAVAAPLGMSVLRASSLNRATTMIMDELNAARQLAMTRNCEVEVRFYKIAADASTQDLQFRAFRTFVMEPGAAGQGRPQGDVRYLPESIIIAADAESSTLFDYGNPNRSGLFLTRETLPGHATEVEGLGFVFRPNGGTQLGPIDPPEGNWFMTFFSQHDPLNPETGLPYNFGTVQVDPVTGRARVFRP